jgi:hypothetical protein
MSKTMQLSNLPFFSELEQSETILLAGAGGGFDIFCGLPLYFSLRAMGKTVYLANLSFSYLPESEVRLSPSLLKVTADTPRPRDYFPEQYLAKWFRQQGQETPIYWALLNWSMKSGSPSLAGKGLGRLGYPMR